MQHDRVQRQGERSLSQKRNLYDSIFMKFLKLIYDGKTQHMVSGEMGMRTDLEEARGNLLN